MVTRSADDTDRFFESEMRRSVAGYLAGERSWPSAVELGLPAMGVAEEDGGLGLELHQEAVAFEALGAVPHESPLFASSVLALPFLDKGLRGELAEGHRTFTLAWGAPVGSARLNSTAAPGSATRSGEHWILRGTYGFVPSAGAVDAAVVIAQTDRGPAAFLVESESSAVERSEIASFDASRRSGLLNLGDAGARLLAEGAAFAAALEDASTRAGCLLAAEALGAGTSALDQAVAHVQQRHAFGRPLAAFQAVSHMLADTYVALMVARGVLDWAIAVARSSDRLLRPLAAGAARGAAAEAALQAAERAIQLFGGMGFTWDAELHTLLRRAQWIGGFDLPPSAAFAALGERVARSGELGRVLTTELFDTAEQAAWRREVREWVDANHDDARRGIAGADPAREPSAYSRAWAKRALAAGFATAHWPTEFGGAGRGIVEAGIASEEIARAHARAWEYRCGIEIVAPSVMRHGTPEQRDRVLGAIRRGERWAQGFSEPDSGSDLASLQTSATPDADGFRLNGIKVWITSASHADRLLLLARTSGRRSKGITCFLVDADAAGVTINDLRDITGGCDEFGEVILDDVYVDRRDVLGEIDGGWQVTLGQLDDERRRGAFEETADLDNFFDRVVEAGCGHSADPTLSVRAGRVWTALAGLKALNRRVTDAMDRGAVLPEGLVTKLVFSEVGQQIGDLAVDALGPAGVIAGDDAATRGARVMRMSARAYTIYAGSTEIMRSLIAEQILNLPRSR